MEDPTRPAGPRPDEEDLTLDSEGGSEEAASAGAPLDGLPDEGPVRRFPTSTVGRPRIEGVQAGVAAGLVPPPGSRDAGERTARHAPRHLAASERLLEEPVPEEILQGVELPDWTDPPTREVPRVLLREGEPGGPVIPGPVWRESERDFQQDEEAFAELISQAVPVVEHGPAGDDDELGLGAELFGPPLPHSRHGEDSGAPGEDTAIHPVAGPVAGGPVPGFAEQHGMPLDRVAPPSGSPGASVSFAGRVTPQAPAGIATAPVAPSPSEAGGTEPPGREQPSLKGRNPVVATATGLGIGGVALVCFWFGSQSALTLSAVVLLLAAAECFRSLRSAHYQPASLLGLIAAPGFAVAAYVRGPSAIPVVGALAVVATIGWYLVGVTRRHVVANISVTLLGIGWIALLGSFAGLLLDPTAYPGGHGVAYLLGAAEVTVAYDVGGYAFGSLFGRHPLAPTVSPGKTWEGLVAGSLAALVVALAVTSQMHPWTLPRAAALGVVAAIVAPIGDLAESMIKRDLKVKDMGTLLPAHGGVLDRIDALLFMLPATYFLVRLFHG
jgi:CDP-diglyceride synthetase